MTDYSKLVEALRNCDEYAFCNDCPIFETCDGDVDKAMAIAAAEIEDLQAQLPKRGEWIRHPEVKNIYGGEFIECPFCGEKYVVQYIADEKFCRNCGADMRAKMEVQE